jgi:superfamily II DNA or RNA helicase
MGITFGGFRRRIELFLQKNQIPYHLDNQQELLPEPDLSRLSSLRELQPEVLAAVAASYRGIIEAPTAAGKSFLVQQLCRAYPTLKILVTTKLASKVNDFYAALAADNIKVSLCDGGHRFIAESSVVVCNCLSLHKIPADWPQLLLYDEVHNAAAKGISTTLGRFISPNKWPKFFGLSASPKGRTDGAAKVIEGYFGSPIIEISYQTAEKVGLVSPIDVWVFNVTAPDQSSFKTKVSRDRNGLWRNRFRNRKIAEVARQMEEQGQVLIMVKTLEHALRLKKLLPDYQEVHAGASVGQWEKFRKADLVQQGMQPSVNVKELQQGFRDGTLKKAIATGVWGEGVDFPNLQFLIRADGEQGEIPSTQIPGRVSRIVEGKTKGIVVDFFDDFGDIFKNRSRRRIALYRSKGWNVRMFN